MTIIRTLDDRTEFVRDYHDFHELILKYMGQEAADFYLMDLRGIKTDLQSAISCLDAYIDDEITDERERRILDSEIRFTLRNLQESLP